MRLFLFARPFSFRLLFRSGPRLRPLNGTLLRARLLFCRGGAGAECCSGLAGGAGAVCFRIASEVRVDFLCSTAGWGVRS